MALLGLIVGYVAAGATEKDDEKKYVGDKEFVEALGDYTTKVYSFMDLFEKRLVNLNVRNQQYRPTAVTLIAQFLKTNYELKGRLAREKFSLIYANFKNTCRKIVAVYKAGVAPKLINGDDWEKFKDFVDYVLENTYLLPDSVYDSLMGRRG